MPGELLEVAVEDRFVVLKLDVRGATLPMSDRAESVAKIVMALSNQYAIMADVRGLNDDRTPTEDVVELLSALSEHDKVIVLCHHDTDRTFLRDLGSGTRVLKLKSDPPLAYEPLPSHLMDLGDASESYRLQTTNDPDAPSTASEWAGVVKVGDGFPEWGVDHFNKLRRADPSSDELWNTFIASAEDVLYARRAMEMFVHRHGRNSLLTQYAVSLEDSEFHVSALHTHGVFELEAQHDIQKARPAIVARHTNTLIKRELQAFRDLLQRPRLKENDVGDFLEQHPDVFARMGYMQVIPQVVLERHDGSSLRPDFFLQPVGTDWWDILDLKLPKMPVLVGRPDRQTFSRHVTSLAAQLREYAAYFEDASLATRVEKKYGIKCYRPRLIGVIGTSPTVQDEREARRAMTQYADLSLRTFDDLLRVAQERILI